MTIRIIKHEAVRQLLKFESPDGREFKFFYWDDIPGRRLRPDRVPGAEALEQAQAVAARDRVFGHRRPAFLICRETVLMAILILPGLGCVLEL